MKVTIAIRYLNRYYRANSIKFGTSIICFSICYHTVATIFSFSSVIEGRATQAYTNHFGEADFIIAPSSGIHFTAEGKLITDESLNGQLVKEVQNAIPSSNLELIASSETGVTSFIAIKGVPVSRVKPLSDSLFLYFSSGFYVNPEKSGSKSIIYDIKGSQNRVAFFSFQNQISAFQLGNQLSSQLGVISRIIFGSAVLFTLYITLLFYKERRPEYSTLLIQGYIDDNLKIVFTDIIIQNLLGFLLATGLLVMSLRIYFEDMESYLMAVKGLLYTIPYLPVILIVQLLLCLNQAVNHATNFK